MVKKKQFISSFFITILLMITIVAVSVLNVGENLDGAVSSVERTKNYQNFCTDDDPEDDFYVAGKVQMGNKLYSDYCIGDSVIQQYCSSGRNVKIRRPFDCPNGCFKGACK